MNQITIVGMGPGSKEYLTVQAIEALTTLPNVYLRTEKHPVVEYLVQKGMRYQSFDELYEAADTFEETYETIANKVLLLAKAGPVVYAVPGNPFVAEKTVALIIASHPNALIKIVHGVSFIDAIITALKYDPVKGLEIVDGLKIESETLNPKKDRLIIQVYNQMVASTVKLQLMLRYQDDHEVVVVNAAGIESLEKIERVPLFELDRNPERFNHLTSLFVPAANASGYTFEDLQNIMVKLRSDNGCPWDREQTHRSLTKYLVEEAYEVLDAVESEDDNALIDELGDVLLQVVFHATIANEDGYFSMDDITDGICQKMIRRHPHVFGDVDVSGSDEVLVNWQAIKAKEKQTEKIHEAMNAVATSIPALIRSQKVQKIAANVGFDWQNVKEAIKKIDEELGEFKVEVEAQDFMKLEEELGDLLMIISNVARHLKIDAEIALAKAIEKFIRRFKYVEEKLAESNEIPNSEALDKMDKLWLEAKIWDKY
ncbi:nucleoside triphosphate pyrophosphohydrolase [Fusibacter sp. 3D3]|uniref:nucleoside triphosphate pyrophosphohydrolase n=1 Tax=Fusibacter sp. 3D3 TaxID=1048380 RepID=UPI000853D883|nr:nucleoside triphosphate pyrophosphohydrolase [Fusibacter sp. 3D3]GAU76109.1 nucleoside triphosphate pyrophosphohydrolase MazG [Fusibacter sp. 3D3]